MSKMWLKWMRVPENNKANEIIDFVFLIIKKYIIWPH